jgi:hypothetical protein
MNRDRNVAFASSALALLLCAATAACGSDPPDATVSFVSSGCKSKVGQALTAPAAEVAYDGLRCLAWDLAAPVPSFRLYNMEGACGASYQGQSFLADDGRSVTLSMTNPSEAIAGCGWCIYDHAFEVAGAAKGADLTVAIQRSNSKERGKEGTITFAVPAGSRPTGVVCDYGHQFAMLDHASKTGTTGKRNRPCSSITGAAQGCDNGLTCTAVAADPGFALCLSGCAGDGDCGEGQLYTCASSVCRLKTTGGN